MSNAFYHSRSSSSFSYKRQSSDHHACGKTTQAKKLEVDATYFSRRNVPPPPLAQPRSQLLQKRPLYLKNKGIRTYSKIFIFFVIAWTISLWHINSHLEENISLSLSRMMSSLLYYQQQNDVMNKYSLQIRSLLSDSIRDQTLQKKLDHQNFLVFRPIKPGQGVGNIMNGLLAVHLLGLEFDRIVCVSPEYKEFHLVFQSIHPMGVKYCPLLLTNNNRHAEDIIDDDNSNNNIRSNNYQDDLGFIEEPNDNNSFYLLNYYYKPNECMLKEMLLSSTKRIWFVTANTYPRWSDVPDHFSFFTYYKPKPVLLNTLPYDHISNPPKTVVHLRQPDDHDDQRAGLDEVTLRELGKVLPKGNLTYLVSNNIKWYHRFNNQYGWSHPSWVLHIQHSAIGNMSWGVEEESQQKQQQMNWTTEKHQQRRLSHNNNSTSKSQDSHIIISDNDEIQQTLQLWCDWYTILRAKRVYHTHSDFSSSAIHWEQKHNNMWSRIIYGYDERKEQKLLLDQEYWVKSKSGAKRLQPRLIDRIGSKQLNRCKTVWKLLPPISERK